LNASTIANLRRLGPLLTAGLLVCAGLVSLALQVFVFRSKVAEEDWRRAAAYVVEALEATDVVRVHPWWNEDPLPHLTAVGNQLHRHRLPLVEDLQNIERIFIIAEAARLSQAFEHLPFDVEPSQIAAFGTVSVALVDVPAWAQFELRLSDVLDTARVSRRRGDESEPCKTWDGRARQWHCGRRDQTFYVGEALLELDDDPRRCIWAHPVEGRVLRIEFDDVELEEVLRIRAGLDLRATRFEQTAPVDYRVFLDDELVVSRTVSPHDDSWYAHDLDVSSRASRPDGPARVALEVETSNVRHRRFCFNGWTMSREQAQRSTRMR
jgi:hypothetical protein